MYMLSLLSLKDLKKIKLTIQSSRIALEFKFLHLNG